jgi:cytochrome P450
VRIAPNEVHLADPDDYDKIFNVGSKFYKDPQFYATMGPDIMFTTVSNDLHRIRRAPLERFFSRKAILEMEDIVKDKVNKLCRTIRENCEAGRPTDVGAAFRAVSIDVITEYAFDNCWNHLDDADFGDWYTEAVRGTSIMWYNFQQFPFLTKPMMSLPQRVGRAMDPMMGDWFDCINRTTDYVMGVKLAHENGVKPKRRTIFHDLLDSDVSMTDQALAGEALGFCNAAAETAGSAMEMTTYQVCTNPEIYKRLREELCAAFPDPDTINLAALEKLPYLTGVVKEGLR